MQGRGLDEQCRDLILLAQHKGMERQFSMDFVELGLDEKGPLNFSPTATALKRLSNVGMAGDIEYALSKSKAFKKSDTTGNVLRRRGISLDARYSACSS